MLRKHRALFIFDKSSPAVTLDIYRRFLEGRNDFKVYTCSYEISEICFEILDKHPETVFFSTDHFSGINDLKEFIAAIEGLNRQLILINVYSIEDHGIMDYIDNVVFVYNVNVLSSIKYPLLLIDQYTSDIRCGTKEFERDLNEYVHDLVSGFNCQRLRNGSVYVTQSILYILKNDNKYVTFYKDVYPFLIKKYDVTLESIDNAMRRFVNAAWENCSEEFKKKYFCGYINNNIKPTSQEFVFEIADHIYIENRKEICGYYIDRCH